MEHLNVRCYRSWVVFGTMLALTVLNCLWIAQIEQAYWIRSLLCLGVGALLGTMASAVYIAWVQRSFP